MRKSERVKGWRFMGIDAAGAGVLAAMTLGVYLLQIQPLLRASRVHAAQAVLLETQQRKLPDLKHSAQAFHTRLEATEKAIAATALQLLPARRLNERLAQLAELATQNGLRIDEIEPGKTTVNAQYETIAIRLSGKGGYRQCTQFLAALHSQMPDTNATAIHLAAGDRPELAGTFTFNLLWHTAPPEPSEAPEPSQTPMAVMQK